MYLEGRFIQDLTTLTGPKMAFPEHLPSLAVARDLSYLRRAIQSEPGLGGQLDHAGPLGMDLLMF